jgi:hypothetical protein
VDVIEILSDSDSDMPSLPFPKESLKGTEKVSGIIPKSLHVFATHWEGSGRKIDSDGHFVMPSLLGEALKLAPLKSHPQQDEQHVVDVIEILSDLDSDMPSLLFLKESLKGTNKVSSIIPRSLHVVATHWEGSSGKIDSDGRFVVPSPLGEALKSAPSKSHPQQDGVYLTPPHILRYSLHTPRST